MPEESSTPTTPDETPEALTDGRRGWIRMEDPSTGGQFDVRSDYVGSYEADGCKRVPGYPVEYGEQARPPKSRTDLAGQVVKPSVTSRTVPSTDEQSPVVGAEEKPRARQRTSS